MECRRSTSLTSELCFAALLCSRAVQQGIASMSALCTDATNQAVRCWAPASQLVPSRQASHSARSPAALSHCVGCWLWLKRAGQTPSAESLQRWRSSMRARHAGPRTASGSAAAGGEGRHGLWQQQTAGKRQRQQHGCTKHWAAAARHCKHQTRAYASPWACVSSCQANCQPLVSHGSAGSLCLPLYSWGRTGYTPVGSIGCWLVSLPLGRIAQVACWAYFWPTYKFQGKSGVSWEATLQGKQRSHRSRRRLLCRGCHLCCWLLLGRRLCCLAVPLERRCEARGLPSLLRGLHHAPHGLERAADAGWLLRLLRLAAPRQHAPRRAVLAVLGVGCWKEGQWFSASAWRPLGCQAERSKGCEWADMRSRTACGCSARADKLAADLVPSRHIPSTARQALLLTLLKKPNTHSITGRDAPATSALSAPSRSSRRSSSCGSACCPARAAAAGSAAQRLQQSGKETMGVVMEDGTAASAGAAGSGGGNGEGGGVTAAAKPARQCVAVPFGSSSMATHPQQRTVFGLGQSALPHLGVWRAVLD